MSEDISSLEFKWSEAPEPIYRNAEGKPRPGNWIEDQVQLLFEAHPDNIERFAEHDSDDHIELLAGYLGSSSSVQQVEVQRWIKPDGTLREIGLYGYNGEYGGTIVSNAEGRLIHFMGDNATGKFPSLKKPLLWARLFRTHV